MDFFSKIGEFFAHELHGLDSSGVERVYGGITNSTVILMGLGVVFSGLIVLIIACYIMGAFFKAAGKGDEGKKAAAPVVQTPAAGDTIPNRAEFIAAVSAAIAEASGTDAAGIRIVSIEKK